MRYAELDGSGKVRFVLPAELAEAYTVLPPNGVEIALDAEVQVGMIYIGGVFRFQTSEEIAAEHRPAFEAERARRFAETAWARERHADREEMAIDDDVNWRAWLAYWQALRDMPEQEGFSEVNPNWPVQPE